jgi:hypothetical protein
MEVNQTLGRYKHTRRITGRRAITPIQSKNRKIIKKTRGHKVERRPYVSILKHSVSHVAGEWKETDKSQLGEHSERQGDEDSHDKGEWKNEEELSSPQQIRNTENSEKSVHPGPVQTMPDLPEQAAYDQASDKKEIEAELLL